MFSFSQCNSARKLVENPPAGIGEAYYKTWAAGTREGGSGMNLFIPCVDLNTMQLDSVYFRGKVAKLVPASNGEAYIGQFKKRDKYSNHIIMSNESGAEYGNQVPDLPKNIPFELEIDECIVSYLKAGKTVYFKISNIAHKKDSGDTRFPTPVRQ